ncbi:diaminopropionate ammonia-lyase [Fulvivirgaceae bacterium BMA10]|uniref:Diaminopropionate ammonia-lyase n=1 Tax=Splendidivirga corallicola TaxID=3051826 RepID=A0ABT8KXM1_9BACT|nr:diaminopropionate ammonia-lyase [Fulvivirgaceae bacterium BMA10]
MEKVLNSKCCHAFNPDFVDSPVLPQLDDPKNVFTFHKTLSNYKSTPLITLKSLAHHLNVGEIWIKDESKRFGLNAFKGLGASYAIHRFLKQYPGETTFCSATDGNHGKALAWASKLFNCKARIFVPHYTSEGRIRQIEKYGAIVERVRGDYDSSILAAIEASEKEGWSLIQDTSWKGYTEIPKWIMSGYLTSLLEIESTLFKNKESKVDFVFLQAGVGSWAASVVWYLRQKYGEHVPKIIIVEPRASDGLLQSIRVNNLVKSKGTGETIMAGLNCGTPSVLAWEILKNSAHYFMTISDSYSKLAMRQLFYPHVNDPSIISGESGAAGLAAILSIFNDRELVPLRNSLGINQNSRILLFNTEGDTDRSSFEDITYSEINSGLISA